MKNLIYSSNCFEIFFLARPSIGGDADALLRSTSDDYQNGEKVNSNSLSFRKNYIVEKNMIFVG